MSQEIDLGIDGLTDYKEVGRGGFAVVYSADQTAFSRRVAVKVLDAVDDAGLRRFNREQLSLGSVAHHPNIVTPFSSGFTQPDTKPYLVMEYLSGGSLQSWIDDGGPIDIFDAVELILPVADALGHSHRSGLIHKDVKPSNILISATGEAKLTDFGIAALQESTTTAAVSFSLAYSAPETFGRADTGNDDPRDERSDLYSLAATLFAMITGRDPFHHPGNQTFAGYMARIIHDPVPSCGHHELDAFFAVAMAKDPNDRYRTAVQFVAALEAAAYRSPTITGPNDHRRTGTRPGRLVADPTLPALDRSQDAAITGTGTDRALDRPPSNRRPWWRSGPVAAGAASLILAVGAGAAVLALRPTDDGWAPTAVIYRGHIDSVRSLVELPDGDIVSAGNDGTAQRWDPDDPTAQPSVYRGHDDAVRSIALTPDGRVASGSRDGTVQVWDPDDPTSEAFTYSGHGAEVESIAALADGRIASASFDGTVHVWDPGDPDAEPAVYRGHGAAVEAVIALADGRIASAGADNTVHLWNPDAPDDRAAVYIGHTDGIEALAQLATGRIASAGSDTAVHLWDPNAPEGLAVVYAGHEAGVESIVQLEDGRLASAGDDDTVHLWDPNAADDEARIYRGHAIDVETVIQLSDGRIASGSSDTTVHLWDPSE